jgi:hypothetical protein
MMQTIDGKLYVIAGKSRQGKTVFSSREVKKHKRAIAWDPEDQWSALPGWKRITSKAALLLAVQQSGNAKLAYVAGGDLKEEFGFWAGCVFYWGRYHGPCAAVGEELADVTTSSKAPGNWGILLRRGLKRGIDIYAISQRWAEADKTALGNATEFVCFAMLPMDQEYMSRRTGIAVAALAALKPLEYVRLDVATTKKTFSKLSFR